MAKIDDSVKKKVPELRFKGFTDEWELRKLGEITEVITKGSTPLDKSWSGPVNYVKTESINKDNGQISMTANTSLEEHENYLKRSKLKDGDLLFSIVGTLGRVGLVEEKDLPANTNQQISIIRLCEGDKYFLFNTLKTHRIISFIKSDATIGVQPSLSLWQIEGLSVPFPNVKEQVKIGSFFKQLDTTITLHQRKIDLLKEQKKGYLQKMFPKNGAKVPELRFAGFADDWEDRKLSSIAERVTRKNKNNESTLPLTISAQDGLVDQNDYFNKQVASRDVTGYFLVKNGEFAYNKSYSNGYPWGAIKRLDKYEMGVLSTLYIVFKPTAINSQFLVSYYETIRWYREVSKNAAEGARNHGLLNISPNDFFNTLLTIPKSAEEQQQIGSFFKQLDDTIALHQRKLDLLKEQKKGFLQKMFV